MTAIDGGKLNGDGQHLEFAAQEGLASVVRQELAFYMHEGRAPTRQKGIKRRGGILYRSSDGFVCIWAGPHFSKLIDMLGNPDWAENELFKDPGARAENWDGLKLLMEEWLSGQTSQDVFHAAQAKRCPVAPVNTIADLVNSEHLAAREFFVDIEHPEMGVVKTPSAPYRLSETPWRVERPAPRLGSHIEARYCGRLG